MDQDAAAIGDQPVQLQGHAGPIRLEPGTRCVQVRDRQVVPLKAALKDSLTRTRRLGDAYPDFQSAT